MTESLRRSRYATTFHVRVGMDTAKIDAFIKVIDAPRGFGRLKRLFREAAGRHVANITHELNRAGFHAPPVLMHGENAISGREVLVTRRAEGRGPLDTIGSIAGSPVNKRAIMRALGREVARLHRAGFVHGDLTPFNILFLWDEPPRFTFLDHERTRRNPIIARRRHQLRNLVQLGRFDLPGITRSDRVRFFRAYEIELSGQRRRASLRRIAAMLNRRIARDGLERPESA